MTFLQPPGVTRTVLNTVVARRAPGRLYDRAPGAADDTRVGHYEPGEISGISMGIGTGGTGYTTASVSIAAPGAGVTATANAILFGGAVIGFTMTNRGSGYTTPPAVTVTGDGTGAAGTACVARANIWNQNGQIYTTYRSAAGRAMWLPRSVGGLPATPLGIWGTRRLVPTYTGNLIRVVRSDLATFDVPQAPDGSADVSALAAFLGTLVGRVDIVYDQAGGARNLTQTTDANRPFVDVKNGLLRSNKPTLVIRNVGDYMDSGVATWMNIPVAVSATSQASSAFMVVSGVQRINQSPLLWWENATNPTILGIAPTSASFFGTQIGAQNKFNLRHIPVNPSVIGFCSAAAEMSVFAGQEATRSTPAGTLVTTAGGRVGVSAAPSTVRNSDFDWTALAMYARGLTEAERLDLTAVLTTTFGLVPQVSDAVVIRGDSIAMGLKVTDLMQLSSLLARTLGYDANFYNCAQSGLLGSEIVTSNRLMWPLLQPGARNNVVFYNAGTNDIIPGAQTAAQLFESLMLVREQMTAIVPSAKLVVSTLLPRGVFTAPNQTEALAYNALVRANGGRARIDAVADIANDPLIGWPSGFSGVGFGDTTHPNSIGASVMAEIIGAAIRTVWDV